MQMEWIQVLGLLGLFIFTRAQTTTSPIPQPSYLVLVPRELQPGVPTTVSVTILINSTVTVFAEIVNGNNSVAINATINGGSTEGLVFPPIPHGESSYRDPYMLLVKGCVGTDVVFKNSTSLRFNPRGFLTFIQTDKSNYQPGQSVKIRVVIIHSDGRPYESQIDIIIKDSKGNMIRQWLSLDSVLGVVSKELQLSENPPLGTWTIVASVGGVNSEKQFNVAHYVLPKFEVLIEAPPVIYIDDSIVGSVTAKYMYGKHVNGDMKITYLHRFHDSEVVYNENKEIDGITDFTFDVPDYRENNKRSAEYFNDEDYEDDESITIVVHVTEYLTGLTYNSTVKVSLVKSRYKLIYEEYSTAIKPSLNFTVKLKISTFDNHALTVEDQEKTVTVSITQHRRSPWTSEWGEEDDFMPRWRNRSGVAPEKPEETTVHDMELPVPADGVISLNIPLSHDIQRLTIDASFEDINKMLQLFSVYSPPSGAYLQIKRPPLPPQVGNPLQLSIQSNFQMHEVHYTVTSKGQIVSAGKGSVPLTLAPEASWAPMACIIVYYVHPDGEIINDVLQLPITQGLKNQVHVGWNVGMARPADIVSLSVSVAEPKSLVLILVVDKATSWAGSHNDITEETVLKEMMEYSSNKADHSLDGMRMGDPYSIFTICDLVVLTDANLHKMTFGGLPEEDINLFGGADGPEKEQDKEPRVRRNFPETWLWRDINTGDSTTAKLTLTVPDSITSWKATAFVMSKHLGLGILEIPAELTVFQDFFLSLNLPAYIIRGEQLMVEVTLFNYLPQDLVVMVIVAESDSFQFVFADNEGLTMASTRQVSVGSQDGITILFPIIPLVLGEIPISVTATSSLASDAIVKMVLVKSEGIEQSYSTSLFLELAPSESSLSRNVMFTFPADVVEGSERAKVTAVGDILGPSIKGLGSLIRMPYGCGEQNMINFAPNIYIIQYLTVTGQTNQNIIDKATSYMMTGYERELSYQRVDGSFSAFGDSDSSGSTWLSAFVLRCFLQARPFIDIDQMVLSRTAVWLGGQKDADGSYVEPGRVIHTELQGGLDGPVSLTAYVLLALLEDDVVKNQYWSQVSEATLYLETRLALGISSNYSLCLVTYALACADSESADTALTELMARAEMRDGVPFWSSSDEGLSASWQPRSAYIEMTAYLLLSLHKLGRVVQGFALMKWLSQQRNDRGGFGSTQDTVVALEALSNAYAAYSADQNTDITIRVNTNVSPSTTVAVFHIDQTNYLLHQSQQVDSDTMEELHLQVTAEGRGFALFQMNVFYNIESRGQSRRRREIHENEAFYLNIEFYDDGMYHAHLYICTRLLEGLSINQTGMAIMEVGLLSGLSLAQEGIQTNDVIKRVETRPGKVILYLDSVTTMEMCLEIPLVMEYMVVKVQDAFVLIYDYYETRRHTVRFYTSPLRRDMSVCSFCGDDCSECKAQESSIFGSAPLSSHPHQMAIFVFTLLIFLVFGE